MAFVGWGEEAQWSSKAGGNFIDTANNYQDEQVSTRMGIVVRVGGDGANISYSLR